VVNDTSKCDGGLRWQAVSTNNGFNYVNTIASACYLNIGARLARYFKNDDYLEMANTTWDFLTARSYIDADGNVYDGAHYIPGTNDCDDINKAQFSYNPAILIQGCAIAYNYVSAGLLWCCAG
jgi:mannan endo-1,6-alpha-mannosidase